MEKTINFGLNKPSPNDFYNIEDFNENAVIIDETLKSQEEAIKSTNRNIEKVDATVKMHDDSIKTLEEKCENEIVTTDTTTLRNSKAGGIRVIGIDGNSEQNTTSGKNSLDCSGLVKQTINGIEFTPVKDANGNLLYVEANGVATAQTSLMVGVFEVTDSSSYILNGCPSGGNGKYKQVLNALGLNDLGTGVMFNASAITGVSIVIESGFTAEHLRFHPMISKEGGEYEPYTNGASPNPDYPQEIVSFGDCVEMQQGYRTVGGGYISSTSRISTKNPIPCKVGDVVKVDVDDSLDVTISGIFFKGDTYTGVVDATDGVFTVPSSVKVDNFHLNINENNNTALTPQTVGKITLTVNGKYVVPIKTRGKNLFIVDDIKKSDSTTFDKDGWITITKDNTSGTTRSFILPNYAKLSKLIEPNKNYILVCEVKTNTSDQLILTSKHETSMRSYFSTDYSLHNKETGVFFVPITSRDSFDACETIVRFGIGVDGGKKATATLRISILEDTIATADTFAYEPYTEHTEYIYLNEPPRKVGDVADRIVEKDGVFMVWRNINTKIINGNMLDDFQTVPSQGDNVNYASIFDISEHGLKDYKQISEDIASYLCDSYVTIPLSKRYQDNTLFINGQGSIILCDNSYTTLEEFKTALNEKPITLFYSSKNPTFEPLDEASQKALRRLLAYDDVTYIEVDSTVPPSKVEVEYGTSKVGALSIENANLREILEFDVNTKMSTSDIYVETFTMDWNIDPKNALSVSFVFPIQSSGNYKPLCVINVISGNPFAVVDKCNLSNNACEVELFCTDTTEPISGTVTVTVLMIKDN